MNRLMEILEKENDFSPTRLKQVYRRLCKETHPDTENGTHEEFIRLREEFEEALSTIGKRRPTARQKSTVTPSDAREAALEKLYLFSMRLFGGGGEATLDELIDAALPYRKDVSALWKEYRGVFYKARKKWMDDGEIFYTHNLFISCVKQLFYYYSSSSVRYKNLLIAYLGDLEKRFSKLNAEQVRVLRGLSVWLKDEAEGEKVALF